MIITVIILDTHIWIWWVQGDTRLTQHQQHWIQQHESQGLGVSMISCWEVAKLVENDRLVLPETVENWFSLALSYPGIQLLDLTIEIVVESTRLIGFHRDPADQMIVATARVYDCPLLTVDRKILSYPQVKTLQ